MVIIKRIKAWIDSCISRAVKRELNKIFREDGEVCVDHHLKSSSWAVIKVDTGEHSCYLKFLDLGKKNLQELVRFLDQFEMPQKVDSTPDIESRLNNPYKFF